MNSLVGQVTACATAVSSCLILRSSEMLLGFFRFQLLENFLIPNIIDSGTVFGRYMVIGLSLSHVTPEK